MTILYRAVPRAGFNPDTVYHHLSSVRAPSNIPYVVDNLWEFLRPDDMPSRRHAVYASPTPELALANASSAGTDRSEYLVCEVRFNGEVRMAQLPVSDARHHPDLTKLQRMVLAVLGRDFSDRPFTERLALGPLFMPFLRAEDLAFMVEKIALARAVVERARHISNFWQSVTVGIDERISGELFFELVGNATYSLVPLPGQDHDQTR